MVKRTVSTTTGAVLIKLLTLRGKFGTIKNQIADSDASRAEKGRAEEDQTAKNVIGLTSINKLINKPQNKKNNA